MKMHRPGALPFLLGAVLLLVTSPARAQSYGPPGGGYGPMAPMMGAPSGYAGSPAPMMGYPMQPAAMMAAGPAGPYGPPVVSGPVPAAPGMGGPGMGAPGMGAPGMGAPEPMAMGPEGWVGEGPGMEEGYFMDGEGEYGYGGGLGRRHIGYDILSYILPYAEGGIGSPRWFDVRAEAVNFRRDVSRQVNFTGIGVDAIGGIGLSTDNLHFDPQWGFRIGAAYQVGAGSNIEFGYVGAVNQASQASITGNNNLYSVFSDYGTNPLFGFTETDRSNFQQIAYSTNFNSYELSLRRRWQGRTPRLQGSYLAGVRYFQVVEDFSYNTTSNLPLQGAFLNYDVGTSNSLTGLQLGGDIWATIIPGLSVGTEGKVGVYGNHAHQNTRAFATTIPNGFLETTGSDDVAFVGEASFNIVYRTSYHWTFRGGYNLIVVDGVALATENFNPGPPFITDPTLASRRTSFFNDNGNIFYYGWTAGLEYVW
ncbi:MAG: hypothetical protein ACKOUR_16925 [Planctomycetota bacterium]